MSGLGLLRMIFMFLYDTFIGKEVSFKDALKNKTGSLFLLVFVTISIGANLLLSQQLRETKQIALKNKDKYMILKKESVEVKERLVQSLYNYDVLYHIHYDHQGNMIIHDSVSGKPTGIVTDKNYNLTPHSHRHTLHLHSSLDAELEHLESLDDAKAHPATTVKK